MIQYVFNAGVTLNIASIPEFNLIFTEQLPNEEIRILVDTSVARTVILPYSTTFPVRNVKITIVDTTGGASGNNITVQASSGVPDDSINGVPYYIVNQNFQAVRFEVLDTNEYAVVNAGTGGGGAALSVNMTYAQLTGAISANALITGQQILLTDYQTASYIQFSGTGAGGIGNEAVNIGAVEPLVLTAISSNQVSNIAQSTVNQQDIIVYLVSVKDGDYEYASAQGKGCIIYREDVSLGIARDYDWRAVVFRRWETSIGSGNYWSFLPVAGAEYQDVNCFWNSGIVQDVYVKSPLKKNALLTGYNYWLDNFVVNASKVVALYCNLSYGSTYSEYTLGDGTIGQSSYNVIFFDVVVSNLIVSNNINTSSQNNIVLPSGNMQGNNIGTFQMNSVSADISYNIVSVIYQVIAGLVDSNIGGVIVDTGQVGCSLQNNTSFSYISGNTSMQVNGNVVDQIISNDSTEIQYNIANSIANNTNIGVVNNNTANRIQHNTNNGDIINNTIGDNISYNNNSGSITGNISTIIGANSNGGDIVDNTVNRITNNSNTLDITSNIGYSYDSNSNTSSINGNLVARVLSNTNLGSISDNTGSIIENNSGTSNIINNNVSIILANQGGAISNNTAAGIKSNVVSDIISNNICHEISSNTITGQIFNNNCTYILSNNLPKGSIFNNCGNAITSNQVGGEISQNNCNIIDSNILGNSIVGCQYVNLNGNTNMSSIVNSSGFSFTGNAISGLINHVFGTVQNCNITATIIFHNFIDEVDSFTINPSPEMQASTPSKSMYDDGYSQHYLVVLNTGLLTFPSQITV